MLLFFVVSFLEVLTNRYLKILIFVCAVACQWCERDGSGFCDDLDRKCPAAFVVSVLRPTGCKRQPSMSAVVDNIKSSSSSSSMSLLLYVVVPVGIVVLCLLIAVVIFAVRARRRKPRDANITNNNDDDKTANESDNNVKINNNDNSNTYDSRDFSTRGSNDGALSEFKSMREEQASGRRFAVPLRVLALSSEHRARADERSSSAASDSPRSAAPSGEYGLLSQLSQFSINTSNESLSSRSALATTPMRTIDRSASDSGTVRRLTVITTPRAATVVAASDGGGSSSGTPRSLTTTPTRVLSEYSTIDYVPTDYSSMPEMGKEN